MDFSKITEITIPEGKVAKITCGGVTLWMAVEEGLPSAYQEVEWIAAAANVGAYINLGFAYDTAAKIHIEQWLNGSTTTTYPFGAANSTGALRCMLSCPYTAAATGFFYGSNGTAYQEKGLAGNVTNGKNEFYAELAEGVFIFRNDTTGIISTTANIKQAKYTMTDNLYLFAQNYKGSPRFGGERKIGKFKYYDKNNELICDLVPCYRKSDNVIGMYDLVRRTFLTNAGTGSFTKGADASTYTNLVEITDETGSDAFDAGRWTNGARMGSDGAYRSNATTMVTNFIPFNEEDGQMVTLYFAGTGFKVGGNGLTAGWNIGVYQTKNGSITKLGGAKTLTEFKAMYTEITDTYYADGTLKTLSGRVRTGHAPYYLRFCLSSDLDKSKIIISKEPIS